LELCKATLAVDFGISKYELPKGYLIPRIPQRLAYLQLVSALFEEAEGEKPKSGFDMYLIIDKLVEVLVRIASTCCLE